MLKIQDDVITLCGSIRFKDDFMREGERLTKLGYVVLMPSIWHYLSDSNLDEAETELKALLTVIHFKKILMSNTIHVINKRGYIGNQTAVEIVYASAFGLKITYMEGR